MGYHVNGAVRVAVNEARGTNTQRFSYEGLFFQTGNSFCTVKHFQCVITESERIRRCETPPTRSCMSSIVIIDKPPIDVSLKELTRGRYCLGFLNITLRYHDDWALQVGIKHLSLITQSTASTCLLAWAVSRYMHNI